MANEKSQYETVVVAPRVVLLGASNLSRLFSTVVQTSHRLLGEPLEFVVAKGHGRSYGQESCFFGKKICGILQSGFWDYLQRHAEAPTYALITDVGNDIAYDVPVETIVEWISECVDRLQSRGAQIVITDLPISAIRQLGNLKFRLLRALFFPTCKLSLEQILHRTEQLSQALNELAGNKKVSIFKAKDEWYGFDPIHIKRRFSLAVWSEVLRGWETQTEHAIHKNRFGFQALYLRCLNPEAWSIFGIERRASQPNGRLQNGTTIAMF